MRPLFEELKPNNQQWGNHTHNPGTQFAGTTLLQFGFPTLATIPTNFTEVVAMAYWLVASIAIGLVPLQMVISTFEGA